MKLKDDEMKVKLNCPVYSRDGNFLVDRKGRLIFLWSGAAEGTKKVVWARMVISKFDCWAEPEPQFRIRKKFSDATWGPEVIELMERALYEYMDQG